jgi:hypothetical protein
VIQHETVERPAGELRAVAGMPGALQILHQSFERGNTVDERLQMRAGAKSFDRPRRRRGRIPSVEIGDLQMQPGRARRWRNRKKAVAERSSATIEQRLHRDRPGAEESAQLKLMAGRRREE